MAGEAFRTGSSTPTGKADIKAELARLGQSLHPAAALQVVKPPPGDTTDVVLVERVVAGQRPDYCLHGYAMCIRCDHMCWLGRETGQAIWSGLLFPLCLECANVTLPHGGVRQGHIDDPQGHP